MAVYSYFDLSTAHLSTAHLTTKNLELLTKLSKDKVEGKKVDLELPLVMATILMELMNFVARKCKETQKDLKACFSVT